MVGQPPMVHTKGGGEKEAMLGVAALAGDGKPREKDIKKW